MKNLFISLVLSGLTFAAFGQITQANAIPSLNEVYIINNGQMMGELSAALRSTDVPVGWFDHRTDLSAKDRYSQVAYQQKEKGFGVNKRVVSYRSDSLIDAEAGEIAQLSVDESMRYWFTSESGVFPDVTLISERAYENVSDAQFLIQSNTTNNRIDQTGFDLIQKTYVLVYHLDKVKYIEEQVENPITKKSSIKKSMSVNYTANVYRLDFDSLGGLELFFSGYWDKPMAWKGFNYSMVKILGSDEKPSLQSTTISLDKGYNHGDAGQHKAALERLARSMRSSALESLTSGSGEFKVRAALSSIRPLEAAVGAKQRIKKHDRFFMYSILENEKGEEVLGRRKGVLRAKVVADNTGATTGEAQFTIFKQYGGGKPYTGIYLESNDDIGLYIEPSASVSIGSSNAFSSSYGLTFGYDFNNVRLGLDFGLLPFAGVDHGWITLNNDLSLPANSAGINYELPGGLPGNAFDVTIDPNASSEDPSDWRGTAMNFGLHIGYNMVLPSRGNVFLLPQIGGGISYLTMGSKSYKNSYLSDVWSLSEEEIGLVAPHNFGAAYLNISMGLGFNISPGFYIMAAPELFGRSPYVLLGKDSDDKLDWSTVTHTPTLSSQEDTRWDNTFRSLDKYTWSPRLRFTLGFRF